MCNKQWMAMAGALCNKQEKASTAGRNLSVWRVICLLTLFSLPVSAQNPDWVYTFKKGDTLWDLCQDYTHKKNCWQELGPYNNVVLPRVIPPGTRVRIPFAWLKQQPKPAIVTYVSGVVEKIDPLGFKSPVSVDDKLMLKWQLEVQDNSSVTLTFADKSTVFLDENSRITLDRLASFDSKEGQDVQIFLDYGLIRSKVPTRQSKAHFNISTPSAVAGVRGTFFQVFVDAQTPEKMRNETFEGGVLVANLVDESLVAEGFGVIAMKNNPLPELRKLPEAPVLFSQKENGFLSAPLLVDWNDVDDASNYIIEIYKKGNAVERLQKISTAVSEFSFADYSPGCYTIKVNAIDNDGFFGMPGEDSICLSDKLAAPNNIQYIKQSARQAVVSWSLNRKAKQYAVQFFSGEQRVPHKETVVSDSFLHITKPNHKNNRLHRKLSPYVRVIAYDAVGNPGWESERIALQSPGPIHDKPSP